MYEIQCKFTFVVLGKTHAKKTENSCMLLLLEVQLHVISSPELKPQSLYPILKWKREAADVTLTNRGTALQYRKMCRNTRGALTKHL